MGGFGAALVEKTETRAREQGRTEGRIEERKEMVEQMLRDGHSPEEIVNFCKYPMELVLDVQKNLTAMV